MPVRYEYIGFDPTQLAFINGPAIEKMSVKKPADRVGGKLELAAGLPTSAYYAESFMLAEQERLFSRTWHAVGFEHDVAQPGDINPVMSAAGRALLIVKGTDQTIRVFHNYCRHRGMRLVDAPMKHLRNIVCPYHSWCYELSGKLARVPHRFGFGKHSDSNADIPGLEAVRCHVWAGLVFVDLSASAPDFDEYIAPLTKRWAHYDLSLLRHDVKMEFDVPGNWKLAIENFIDIYHVPFVHPSLNKYNTMSDHYFIHDDIVLGEGNDKYSPTDDAAGKLPEFPELNAPQRNTIEAVCLFPNLLLTAFSDNLRIILVEPTGPRTCRERVSIAFVGDEAMAPELVDYRTTVANRFPSFNVEDVEAVSKLQHSFETSAFEKAHFNAFFDGAVHRFQELVARSCGG